MKKTLKLENILSKPLCEEFQANTTEIAWAKKIDPSTVQMQCVFVHCRDFLGDCLFAEQEKKSVSIYSFPYDGTVPKLDREFTSFVVRFNEEKNQEAFAENEELFRDILKAAGLPHMTVEKTDKKNIVFVQFDSHWMAAILGVAFLTYLIKCMTYSFKNKDDWMEEILATGTTEARYMDAAYVVALLDGIKAGVFKKFKNVSGLPNQDTAMIGTIHASTGFVAHKMKFLEKKGVFA